MSTRHFAHFLVAKSVSILYFVGQCLRNRIFGLYFGSLKNTKVLVMGGEKSKVEPLSCDGVRQNHKVWIIVEERGLVPYLEKPHGHNREATKLFIKGWKNRTLNVYERDMAINEDVIAKITRLSVHEKSYSEIEKRIMKS